MEPARASQRNSILDGPACTRLAHGSLCVSFLPPGCRLCSFDCTYCSFEHGARPARWPSPDAIESAVILGLRRPEPIQSITIAGPGEQTLHPRFGAAVARVISARQVRPGVPIRISTNGSTLRRHYVRRILEFVDERIVRLNPGGDGVSRMHSEGGLGVLVALLGSLSDFSVEAVFFDGSGANTLPSIVDDWLELIFELQPAHIYVTTLERPPVERGPVPASRPTLEAIAERARTGVDARVEVVV